MYTNRPAHNVAFRMARQGSFEAPARGSHRILNATPPKTANKSGAVNFERIAPDSERASSSVFVRSGASQSRASAQRDRQGEERDGNVGQYQRTEDQKDGRRDVDGQAEETAPIASQAARAGEHHPAESDGQ